MVVLRVLNDHLYESMQISMTGFDDWLADQTGEEGHLLSTSV